MASVLATGAADNFNLDKSTGAFKSAKVWSDNDAYGSSVGTTVANLLATDDVLASAFAVFITTLAVGSVLPTLADNMVLAVVATVISPTALLVKTMLPAPVVTVAGGVYAKADVV